MVGKVDQGYRSDNVERDPQTSMPVTRSYAAPRPFFATDCSACLSLSFSFHVAQADWHAEQRRACIGENSGRGNAQMDITVILFLFDANAGVTRR